MQWHGGLAVAQIPCVAQNGDYEEYMELATPEDGTYFTAEEMLGVYGKVPPEKWWPRLALLRWFADQLRGREPVRLIHAWRPEPFNSERGGKPGSKHIECCAMDLQFSSLMSHQSALDKCEVMWNSPVNWSMGLGVGQNRLHIDFFCRDRPAWWRYGSFSSYNGPVRGLSKNVR